MYLYNLGSKQELGETTKFNVQFNLERLYFVSICPYISSGHPNGFFDISPASHAYLVDVVDVFAAQYHTQYSIARWSSTILSLVG